MLGVLVLVVALAVLPATVALWAVPDAGRPVVVAGAVLAAVAGGFKRAAFRWGLASKGSDRGPRSTASVVD